MENIKRKHILLEKLLEAVNSYFSTKDRTYLCICIVLKSRHIGVLGA